MLLQNMSSHVVVLHRGDVVAQLVIEPVIQAAWRDLSNGTTGSVGKTKDRDVLIDSVKLQEKEEENDKMKSARRTYKSPRHRFSEGEKDEE